jgi:signal transduction histidine kinase
MLRPGRRLQVLQLLGVVVVFVLLGAVTLATQLAQLRWGMGGLWWPIVMTLSVLLLLVALRRPLLAWRIAWLALLYELTMLGTLQGGRDDGWTTHPSWLPDWFPPLFVSEIQIAVFLLVLFVAAASQPRGVVVWVWLLTAGLVCAVPLGWSLGFATVIDRGLALLRGYENWGAVPDASAVQQGGVVLVTVVVVAGQLTRYRSRTHEQLVEAQGHGLVLAERARIARELHDVIAHHMSMIAVRAETAPYRLGTVPPAARDEFHEISQESRTALTEMRRLLGVLRSGGPAPSTTPQPGLADLAELVEAARGAGATVTVEMHGAMTDLPAAVDVCAYRIVQEALTNASRHAVGAPVHVTLRRAGAGLSLSVRNGPGTPSAPRAADGHGVRGMRERAAMLGGALHAGPTADGGFEVSATLPLAEGGSEDSS